MLDLENLRSSKEIVRKGLQDFYGEYFKDGFIDLCEIIREAKMIQKIQMNKLLESKKPIFPADLEE